MVRFVGCIIYDGIGLNLMLPFQDSTQDMTLKEGIDIYQKYLYRHQKKIMIDQENEALIRNHDATHVIFGLDTTLEEEAMLDTWVLFGTNFKFKDLSKYNKKPEIKDLQKKLFSELGIFGLLRLYKNVLRKKITIFKRTRSMKKKWPFQFPESYLDISILKLRDEYGIQILNAEEKSLKEKIIWSGTI